MVMLWACRTQVATRFADGDVPEALKGAGITLIVAGSKLPRWMHLPSGGGDDGSDT